MVTTKISFDNVIELLKDKIKYNGIYTCYYTTDNVVIDIKKPDSKNGYIQIRVVKGTSSDDNSYLITIISNNVQSLTLFITEAEYYSFKSFLLTEVVPCCENRAVDYFFSLFQNEDVQKTIDDVDD